MHTKYTIKTVETDSEASAIRELRRRVFTEEQKIPAELENDGWDDRATLLILSVDGTAVGTGRLIVNAKDDGDKVGVLARIAIHSKYRGRGLGQEVIRELESLARRHGATRLEVHPHEYLEPLYKRLGYQTVPGVSLVAGHHLITMEKALESAEQSD